MNGKISLFLIAILTVLSSVVKGQNTISISPTTSTFSTISTVAGLTTQQTLNQAFTVTIRPKDNPCLVNVSASASNPTMAGKLKMQWDSFSAGSTNVNSYSTALITLQSTAVQIMSTKKANQNISTRYDLLLDGPGWSVQGGASYSYTITISLTPQ